MTYVLDTHPIVWFLEGSGRLSAPAGAILRDPSQQFILPTIVLVEITFLDRIGIPILRLASRPGATRARWGKEGIWCGPLTGWIWWAECGRTALSHTTQPSEVMRPNDDSHSAGLERLQTDLCRALGRL